jgi:hypothetical protein
MNPRRTFPPLAAALLAILIIGCDHSPSYADDDRELGYMSQATADQIFSWAEPKGSAAVEILKFRSAAALRDYLSASRAASASLVINRINGKPVVSIAAGAFSPSARGGADDITTVVSAITLPASIESLGANLFANVSTPVTVTIPREVVEKISLDALKAAAGNSATIQTSNDPAKAPEVIVRGPSGGSGGGGGSSSGSSIGSGSGGSGSGSGSDSDSGPAVYYPPALQGEIAVTYKAAASGVLVPSAAFSFDMAVVLAASPAGWTVAGDGTSVITAAAPEDALPGEPLDLSITAANPQDLSKTTATDITLMPVSVPFPGLNGAVYTVRYADPYGAAGLHDGSALAWYYVEGGVRDLFNAIYTANAPESVDTAALPKAALPYTDEISRTVLDLFQVGGGPDGSPRVTLSGQVLPDFAGKGPNHLIVIDIGLPGADNGSLPPFVIPPGALGTAGAAYGHIRLRVNRGAELILQAEPAGGGVQSGRLSGGAVEVMAGGKLRIRAYDGAPLGEGAAVIARLLSFLALGPESGGNIDPERDPWYQGWLIAPADGDPILSWGSGDQNGDYLEIRGDRIAFAANIALRKTLMLYHRLWFVNGPTLTIDAAADSRSVGGLKGLFSAEAGAKFYGNASVSGGINIGTPAAHILIRPGSSLSRSFLSGDAGGSISGGSGGLTIPNKGSAGSSQVFYDEASPEIFGYLNWEIP